jgi:hypothetical protein
MDLNAESLSFKTTAEVNAYSTFFLNTRPIDSELELKSPEEISEFNNRRETNLKAQLDHFKNIDLSMANKIKVEANYFKLCKSCFTEPLSSYGSHIASTRFNYKNYPLFKNRTIYLSKSKLACETELFHLEEHRELIKKKFSPTNAPTPTHPDDIEISPFNLYEYQISLDNVLVLTSKSSCDAIKITLAAIQNDWFYLNDR